MARLAWLIPVACLLCSLLCRASGEWEGTAEFEVISNAQGVAEEALEITAKLDLESSLAELVSKIFPSFSERISDVHQIKISDLAQAIEDIEALKDDIKNIEEKKISEDLRAEWLSELDAIWVAIEERRLGEAVSRLRTFRSSVSEAYEAQPKKLTRKTDADKLRSKAKTAIRNTNSIEGLKEDVIDFTCIPFDASSKFDCIPVNLAEELKNNLDIAKDAVEDHRNTLALSWLREFINRIEEGYSAGLIISAEADLLISRAETIIGRIDKGARRREVGLNLSAAIAGLELAWGLQAGEAIFPASGKDNQDTTVSFAIAADYGQLDLSLELERQRVDFFQRWSCEDSKLVDQVDFDLELDLGNLELTKSFTYEQTFFPERIGEEVEMTRIAEVKQSIEKLWREIESSLTIPSRVKSELAKKLQSALAALDQGQRTKAVDYLSDFIDLVERRRREGKITKEDAEWLISEAWAILPRERRSITSGMMGVEFVLSSLELEIEGTGTLKAFPAETKKDERDAAFAFGFEAEQGGLALEGSAAWQWKLFPNDPAEDELIQKWEGAATFEEKGFAATGSFGMKTTIYPNNSAKNNTVRTQELEFEWALARADCTLSWEREATDYPNAPTKEKLVEALELVLEFTEPGFTIDLQREATAYPLAPAKDKLVWSARFQLDWELALALQLDLTASFAMESYPAEPTKAKTTASLELALAQEF